MSDTVKSAVYKIVSFEDNTKDNTKSRTNKIVTATKDVKTVYILPFSL